MFDPEPKPISRSFDPADHGDVLVTVVEAIAEAKNEDPVEMDPVLHEAIDPEALARTVVSIDKHVAFTVAGCEVVVYGDGSVVATPVPDRYRGDFTSAPEATGAVAYGQDDD